ncbi:arylsulfatase B-like, partial [Penaeus indicus]|uniref:arylsulfatase B-like n=1 Tax=Penaeus indicus TaxID=29960 RepID=UPI00300C641F
MRLMPPYPAVAPALLALLWLSAAPASAAAASAPNIVFILADDLGWNDVSWHNDQVVSPNMQQLVDTGVQLEQSYVQPLCTPSRSAFLTGLYPFRLGRQGPPLADLTPTGLSLDHTLLPERLSQLGYTTHMIG